jgi:hypothetical protein
MDRRQATRFQIFGEIDARLLAPDMPDVPLLLLDISLAGFAVQSPVAFQPGALYRVQLAAPPLSEVTVHAANVHCAQVFDDGNPWHIAGFAFTAATLTTQRERLMALIDHAVNAQLIDHVIAG